MEEVLGRMARPEVIRRLEAADIPYGQMNDLCDVLEHP